MITFNIEHYIAKDNFLYKQLSDSYKTALHNLINIVVDEYLLFTPMFNKYFTDHGPFHSKAITEVVTNLVQINSEIICEKNQDKVKSTEKLKLYSFLNEDECFILLSSIWLHDIGMIYNVDTVTGQILYEQIHRNAHARQGIKVIFEKRKELFIRTLPYDDILIKLITDVCVNHTSDIKDWSNVEDEFKFQQKSRIRTKLLISLLRIGDILDLRQKRAPQSLIDLLKVPTISRMHWDASELIHFYEVEKHNKKAFIGIYGHAVENLNKDEHKECYKYPLFLYKFTQINKEFRKLKHIFHKYQFSIDIEFEFSHNNFKDKIGSTQLEKDSLDKFKSNNDEGVLFYIARNYYLRNKIIKQYEEYKSNSCNNNGINEIQLIDRLTSYISDLVIDFNEFNDTETHEKANDILLKANLENIEWVFGKFNGANDDSGNYKGFDIIKELREKTDSNHNSLIPPSSYFMFRQSFFWFKEHMQNDKVPTSKMFESFGILFKKNKCKLELLYKKNNKDSVHFNIFKSLKHLENNIYNIHQFNTLLLFLRLGYTQDEHPIIYKEINAIITKLVSQLADNNYTDKKLKIKTNSFEGHVHNKCNLCSGRLLSILCYYLGINKIKDNNHKADVINLINKIVLWIEGQEDNYWATITNDKDKICSPRYTAAVLNGLVDYHFFFHVKENNSFAIDTNKLKSKLSKIYGEEDTIKLIKKVKNLLDGNKNKRFKASRVIKEGDNLPIYTHSLDSLNNYRRLVEIKSVFPALTNIKLSDENSFFSELIKEMYDISSTNTSLLSKAAEWPVFFFENLMDDFNVYNKTINKNNWNIEKINNYILNEILKHPVWDKENGSWGSNIAETFNFLVYWMMYWEEQFRKSLKTENGK